MQRVAWQRMLVRVAMLLGIALAAFRTGAAVFTAPLPQAGDQPSALGRWLAAQHLQSGDVVELPCGGHWEEELTLGAASDLTVRAAAGCSAATRPRLQPMRRLTDWRREEENLYSAAFDAQPGLITVDGRLVLPVKYPATGFLQTGAEWRRIGPARSGSTWLSVLIPGGLKEDKLKGATLHVRNQPWLIETVSVTSQQGGQLQVSGLVHDVPLGASLSLSGQRWMMDDPAAQGWFWDGDGRRLYLRHAPGVQASEADVRVAKAEHGVSAEGARRLRLVGFDILGVGRDGINCERCAEVEIDDLHISIVGRDGVNLPNVKRAKVSRLEVRHAARDGIGLVGAVEAHVQDSFFGEIGTGGWPQSSRAAINGTRSTGLQARGNRIERAGYIGIRLNRNSLITHNEIVDSCTALDDCGAIYSWADADGLPLHADISENLVRGVHGHQNDSPQSYTLAAGIYLDDLSSQISVRDNIVVDAERGLMLHNASANAIQGNTFVSSRAFGLVIDVGHARVAPDRMPVNRITGNAFIASHPRPTVFVLDRRGRAVRDQFIDNMFVLPASGPWLQWQRRDSRQMLAPDRDSDSPFDSHDNQVVVGRVRVFVAGAKPTQWPCPTTACNRIRYVDGRPVNWPLVLPRFSARAVLLEGVP